MKTYFVSYVTDISLRFDFRLTQVDHGISAQLSVFIPLANQEFPVITFFTNTLCLLRPSATKGLYLLLKGVYVHSI